MPKRLSPQEAADLGLHAPTRLSPQEASELGLHADAPPAAPAADPVGAAGTGVLNALDSLSLVGLPTVLGAKDALMGEDSTGKPGNHSAKGVLDRYYANKDFYQGGMDRAAKANPKSAVVGQLAPMLIPGGGAVKGAGLAETMAMGAGQGALSGLLRGQSKTLAGDIAGTAQDTAIGAGVGAGTAGVGYGAGKALGVPAKFLADKGEAGLEKYRGRVEDAVRSKIGGFAKVQQEGQGALFNEAEKRALLARVADRAKANPESMSVAGDLNLAKRGVKYIEGAKADAKANLAKFGNRAHPPHEEMFAEADKSLRDEATGGIKTLANTAIGAGAGYLAADKLGIDPRIGMAVGGAGGLYLVRKAALQVAQHPETLEKMAALKPVQDALARTGGRMGAKGTAAILYSLAQKHPEVHRALLESQKGTSSER